MAGKKPLASVDDVSVLMKLTLEQQEVVETVIEWVSNRLRFEAKKVGFDLDEKIEEDDLYEDVVKTVVAGIVERTIKATGDDSASLLSQFSQSAGGYTISGTYANSGESLYIKRSELKALGINRQRMGWFEPYDY